MRYFWLPIFLTVFLLSNSTNADDKMAFDEVSRKIAALTNLLKDSYAEEYAEARGIEILRDGAEGALAAAAVFTIEGYAKGNNHTQFLAFFARLHESSEAHPNYLSLLDVMAVGGRGIRNIEYETIKMKRSSDGIVITTSALAYAPSDGMCCPTLKTKVHFLIKPIIGGRLREVGSTK